MFELNNTYNMATGMFCGHSSYQ